MRPEIIGHQDYLNCKQTIARLEDAKSIGISQTSEYLNDFKKSVSDYERRCNIIYAWNRSLQESINKTATELSFHQRMDKLKKAKNRHSFHCMLWRYVPEIVPVNSSFKGYTEYNYYLIPVKEQSR